VTWGSVIGHLAVTFDLAKGRRRRRFHEIDQRRRKCRDAHQPAALSVGRMRCFLRGRRATHCRRYRAIVAGIRVQIGAGVVVRVAVLVDMRRRYIIVHVDHSGHVSCVGQTRRNCLRAGQRERDRRRQDAKQVGQGDEPPCSQSLRSGKADEHSTSILSGFFGQTREHSRQPCTSKDGTRTGNHLSARPMTAINSVIFRR
jgi:hypothetical protein